MKTPYKEKKALSFKMLFLCESSDSDDQFLAPLLFGEVSDIDAALELLDEIFWPRGQLHGDGRPARFQHNSRRISILNGFTDDLIILDID